MLRVVQFCCGGKKCPVVAETPEGKFNIGSPEEGITTWDKGQFADFVNSAKEGKFDELIESK